MGGRALLAPPLATALRRTLIKGQRFVLKAKHGFHEINYIRIGSIGFITNYHYASLTIFIIWYGMLHSVISSVRKGSVLVIAPTEVFEQDGNQLRFWADKMIATCCFTKSENVFGAF